MARDLIVTNTSDIQPKLVCGEEITILASGTQTGSYEVYLHNAPEGAGPPPHFRQWDEAFYVIQGVVDFNCGGTERRVAAGGFVHVPGGTIHSFRYASPTAQILGITSEPGAAAMFSAADHECGATPEIEKVLGVLAQNKVTVVL